MALVGVLEDLWLTTAPGKYIGSTDQNDNIGLIYSGTSHETYSTLNR